MAEVFICWSGDGSKEIALKINEWLPTVLQNIKTFCSDSDIDKGARWAQEIASKLENASIGIIIVTPSNLNSKWLHFEAGALSKSMDTARVIPLLFDLKTTDLDDPLKQFQAIVYNRAGMRSLITNINKAANASGLSESQLDKLFNALWTDLESEIASILISDDAPEAPVKSDRDLLEEILQNSRNALQHRLDVIDPRAAVDLAKSLSTAMHYAAQSSYSSQELFDYLLDLVKPVRYIVNKSIPPGRMDDVAKLLDALPTNYSGSQSDTFDDVPF